MMMNFLKSLSYKQSLNLKNDSRIGIRGFKEDIDILTEGKNTALVCKNNNYVILWQKLVLLELLTNYKVFLLIANFDQAKLLEEDASVKKALDDKRLIIWVCNLEDQKKISQEGLFNLFNDLFLAGLDRDTAFFSIDSSGILDKVNLPHLYKMGGQWKKWVANRRAPTVWMFVLYSTLNFELQNFHPLIQAFPYIAELELVGRKINLILHHWGNKEGSIYNIRYEVIVDPKIGAFVTTNNISKIINNRNVTTAEDDQIVYITNACIRGLRNLPSGWIVCENWKDLEYKCAGAFAATVILDAGETRDFKNLAHTVFRLRTNHPPSFKIAIKETDYKLRTNTEEVLMKVGANEIIYKELPFSRVIRKIKSIKNVIFDDELPDDIDKALESYMPPSEGGYVDFYSFCLIVLNELKKPSIEYLSHSLVKLTLSRNTSHLECLKKINVSRQGDIITNVPNGFLVFLYACREVDVDKVLNRMFSTSITDLFDQQECYFVSDEIEQYISSLKNANSKDGLIDYSEFIVNKNKKEIKDHDVVCKKHEVIVEHIIDKPMLSNYAHKKPIWNELVLEEF